MPTVRLEIALAHDAPDDRGDLIREAARALGVGPDRVLALEVVKKALDARRRTGNPIWRYTVDATTEGPLGRPSPHASVRPVPEAPEPLHSPRAPAEAGPIAVIGAGPAGLFAAWHLALHGAKVLLLERGKPVETRARDFGRFRGRGVLDPESNLCFGEGGAGTYSDGKLYTRIKSPLVSEVMERLVQVGAPPRILIDARPHIGTNVLFRILKELRRTLLASGVEIRFETRVDQLAIQNGRIAGVIARGDEIAASRVLLAIGHSARDTFAALFAQGVPMIAKPFAVGVRAEHPQAMIDAGQYRLRAKRPPTLPPADYHLSHEASGRGVYSFCMCPGGMVVPTATELETVVVNGMSTATRGTPFANSGLVAQVDLDDLVREGFGGGALAGVEFQRSLERRAFLHGGGNYFAPAMLAEDLLRGRASARLAASHFRPGLTPADLREVLPPFIASAIREGLARFDHQIPGYASSEANLIAVESRTSSPIQIPRDPVRLEVEGFPGLFAAGEGPGYAGGIVSAAVDGLKAAHQILQSLGNS